MEGSRARAEAEAIYRQILAAEPRHPDALHLPSAALIDLAADLKDFADTAALSAALDLVIAADTAVARRAGTRGKAVWLMRENGDLKTGKRNKNGSGRAIRRKR